MSDKEDNKYLLVRLRDSEIIVPEPVIREPLKSSYPGMVIQFPINFGYHLISQRVFPVPPEKQTLSSQIHPRMRKITDHS